MSAPTFTILEFEMDPTTAKEIAASYVDAAKYIGAGLAAIGMGAAAIGVGTIFGNFLSGALAQPVGRRWAVRSGIHRRRAWPKVSASSPSWSRSCFFS